MRHYFFSSREKITKVTLKSRNGGTHRKVFLGGEILAPSDSEEKILSHIFLIIGEN